MKRLLSMLAAIAVVALAVAGTASAQVTPLSLPAPPAASNAASSTIFDALLSIERAAGSNPRAVQPASLFYTAAIAQYNAGNLQQAQMSALAAINRTAAVPLPTPSLNPPVIPQPDYITMPAVLSADQADAEGYVGLARKSVMLCGGPGPLPDAIQNQYDAAVKALLAGNATAARIASTSVVTQCAAAALAYAATLQAMPAPSTNAGSYQPEPIATLGPDPALVTPAPQMMPSASPSPGAHRGFRL